MKGLSFHDDMALAVLDGRKTQTRRAIKDQSAFRKLLIKSVRAELVRDISEPDVKAEDFGSLEEMKTLWKKINKKSPRELSPWVWVYEFRRTG